jgi:hypothetical protein
LAARRASAQTLQEQSRFFAAEKEEEDANLRMKRREFMKQKYPGELSYSRGDPEIKSK